MRQFVTVAGLWLVCCLWLANGALAQTVLPTKWELRFDLTGAPSPTSAHTFLLADTICGIDPASFILLSETSTAGSCPKDYTRTYQVADLCGNTATCTQTITVNDAIPPQITCPGPLTAICDISEQPAYGSDFAKLAKDPRL